MREFPEAVPPITVCHPATPVERLFVIVFVVRVRPVEKVRVDSLLLKVDQSALLSAPLFIALAVGTLSVITGVVVGFATVELKSVPVVPRVSAATDVTVPDPLLFI